MRKKPYVFAPRLDNTHCDVIWHSALFITVLIVAWVVYMLLRGQRNSDGEENS